MKIRFVKMQGLGNDFILIDALERRIDISPGLVRRLCARRFGVGADQLLLVLPSEAADYRMRIYNADGGEVEMCGNGIRCLARYLVSRGLAPEGELNIETRGGIVKPAVDGDMVTVDMGRPLLDAADIPVRLEGRVVGRDVEVGGSVRRITCVSIGNPHCVIFVDDVDEAPVNDAGPRIERDPLFPRRVNVEFVAVESRKRIAMRVWERGAGETPACGTGACAAVVAGSLNGKTEREAVVRLRGGELKVLWAEDNRVFMTGPAQEVFEGEMSVE